MRMTALAVLLLLFFLTPSKSTGFDSKQSPSLVIQLPVSDLISPSFAGMKADATRSLLAILVRSEKHDQVILYDKTLQPFRRINVPKGIQVFAISSASLYFSIITDHPTAKVSICRLLFAGESQKCLSVPSFPEHLIAMGGGLYEISAGSVFEIHLDTSTRRLLSHHHLLEDAVGSADSDNERLVIANPLSGAGVICMKHGWRCNSIELLSPDQISSRASKHPNEGFLSSVVVNANTIGVMAGRYRATEGFRMILFSLRGGFAGETRLHVPSIADLEPTPRNKALKPSMTFMVDSFVSSFNSKVVVGDKRTLTLVVYPLPN